MSRHGAGNGTWDWRLPPIQSSPNGIPASRAKKPPDIAATTRPQASVQTSVTRFAEPRSATWTTVLRSSWRSTCTVVLLSSPSATRSV